MWLHRACICVHPSMHRPCIQYPCPLPYAYIPTIASMPHKHVNTSINKGKIKGELTRKWIGRVLIRVEACTRIWAEFSFVYKTADRTSFWGELMCRCPVANAPTGAVVGHSACSWVHIWSMYSHVLCLSMPLLMHMCMDVLLCLVLCMYLLIHPSMRPSRKLKLKIVPIPKIEIQNSNSKSNR